MSLRRKLFVFLICFLTIHVALIYINKAVSARKSELVIQLIELKKIKNLKVLFLGDSHTKKAIDTSIIDSSFSVAYSGENNMMNYFKLKHCINKLSVKPNYVIMPCDVVTFAKNFNYSINNKPFYYSFISVNEAYELDSNRILAYYDYFKIKAIPYAEWRYTFNKMNLGKKPDKPKRFKTASELDAFTKKLIYTDANINENKESLYYSRSLLYLQKTISFCKVNHIKPIFIKYPLTHLFLDEVKSATKDTLLNIRPAEDIIQIEQIPILNFEKIYLDNEFLFYDSHHLNDSGKKAFSNMLKLQLDSLYKVY